MTDNMPRPQYQPYPQHQPPIVGWQPIYAQPKPPASGTKIATGILAISTGWWILFVSMMTSMSWFSFDMGFFMLTVIGGLASVVLGIIQLTKTRKAKHHVPTAILWVMIAGALVSLWQVVGEYWTAFNLISFFFCFTTAILAMVAIARKPNSHRY